MSVPTKSEIEDELYEAEKWAMAGQTAYSGMTYEQGVEAALRWVLDGEENPIEEHFED